MDSSETAFAESAFFERSAFLHDLILCKIPRHSLLSLVVIILGGRPDVPESLSKTAFGGLILRAGMKPDVFGCRETESPADARTLVHSPWRGVA